MSKIDISAWLSQASLPEGEVTIYADALAISELKRDDLSAKERAELQKRADASALTIRLRALTDEQRDELEAEYPKPDDSDTDGVRIWNMSYCDGLIAAMAIDPPLAPSHVAQIRERVTPTTYEHIVSVCGSVNRQNSADAPFWRARSGASRA